MYIDICVQFSVFIHMYTSYSNASWTLVTGLLAYSGEFNVLSTTEYNISCSVSF